MDNFNRHQKHKILSAFCNAIREGRLLSNQNKSNKAGSVGSALDHVAQTYKLANRLDPRMATNGKFAFIIQCWLRGYNNSDKPEEQQAAVTGSALQEFYKLSLSKIDRALCQLVIGTFFFAMQSCKYIKVGGIWKTKILCLKNIKFYKEKWIIKYNDKHLHDADTISITFEQQNEIQNDVVTHYRTNDNILCSVKI